MNKKLLLAMTVGLMTYSLLGGTENDPGVKYSDWQLKEIAKAEEYMKSADFKNPKTAKKACILGDVEALKKMKQAGFEKLNDPEYLLLAAECGSLECCKYLIGQGADVNAKNKFSETVLHYAAERGSVELCKYLVEHGAAVNAKDRYSKTALYNAAESGSVELCKYLVEHGADVSAEDFRDETVLHYAARSGSMELCKYLIGFGLDVNAKGFGDGPVLHYAAESGSMELCKYLVEHGADVNAKDNNSLPVLHNAARSGSVELCKYLIGLGLDLNAKNRYDETVLHYAARSGSMELCKYLVEHGADVNAKDMCGLTVLHHAARSGSVELCKYLIGLRLDVNDIVLYCAAESSSVELCKYLIELGLDIKAKNKHGETVLHFAANSGNPELCKYLVEHGAEVNAVDCNDWTFLLYNAESGGVEFCKYLVEHGTDVNAKNGDGWTILDYAADRGSVELCKYLVEHGAEVKGMKVNGDWEEDVKEYLLSQGGILEETEEEEPSADEEDAESADGQEETEEIQSEQEIEAEFETMKGKFGSAYALYVKLCRYQFLLKKKPDAAMQTKAFAVADEIIRTAPKSQFAEAARYLKGVIQADQLSDQSDQKSISEVKQYLEDFIKENPQGLYRGEALMLLGKISLECEWDAKETEKYYEQALVYFRKACEKQSVVSMYDPLSENLKRQAEPVTPLVGVDFKGSVKLEKPDPLKLYNTEIAPEWYAKEQASECARTLMWLAWHRKDRTSAKKYMALFSRYDDYQRERTRLQAPSTIRRYTAVIDNNDPIFTENELKGVSPKTRLAMAYLTDCYLAEHSRPGLELLDKLLRNPKLTNQERGSLLLVRGYCMWNFSEMGGENCEIAIGYYSDALKYLDPQSEMYALAMFEYAVVNPEVGERIKLYEEYMKRFPHSRNISEVHGDLILDYIIGGGAIKNAYKFQNFELAKKMLEEYKKCYDHPEISVDFIESMLKEKTLEAELIKKYQNQGLKDWDEIDQAVSHEMELREKED